MTKRNPVDILERLKQFNEVVRTGIDRVPIYGPITLNQPEVFVCEVEEAINEIAALRKCLKQVQMIAIGRMVGGTGSNESRLGAIDEACRTELLRSGGGRLV
jgi:fumarate hydratase class II